VPLLEAIPFLKNAVKRSNDAMAVYVFHGGAMYATDAAILACYPMPHILGDFSVSAKDIEAILAKADAEPVVEAGDGTLVLRSGRRRNRIDLMACEPPHGHPSTLDGWPNVSPGLWPALKIASTFISSEGSWQRSALLLDGHVRTLNNFRAVDVAVDGLEVGTAGQVALTDDCVAYLSRLDAPERMCIVGGAAWFAWPGGAWVRCQLLSVPWPDIFDRVVDAAGTECPVPIDDAWRAEVAYVASLGDGTVDVSPDGLHGRTEHAMHDVEFATGVSRGTRWSTDALKPMFACGATAWNPDATDAEGDPAPAAFVGPGIRGVVVGMRR
jgi:hypothetical protein